MLKEFTNISQKEKGIRRRWFEDDYFELIVWYDTENSIIGFQLCYGEDGAQKAFTWHSRYGCSHDNIDDSRGSLSNPQTPILIADGPLPVNMLINRFREESNMLETEISNMVINRILKYENQ